MSGTRFAAQTAAIHRRRRALGANLLSGLPPGVPNVFRDATALWDTRLKPCSSTSEDPLIDSMRNGHDLHLGSVRAAYIRDGLRLPGVVGNYAWHPSISLAGDLEIEFGGSADFTTDASGVAKWGTAGSRSFRLAWTAAGNLRLYLSLDGTAVSTHESTAVVSASDGDDGSWKATFDGVDVKFFERSGASWVQVGADVTALIATIFNPSQIVEFGSVEAGADGNYTGFLQYATIRDGVDGSIVSYASFEQPDYTSSFSSSPAGLVTIEQDSDDTNDPVWLPYCAESYLWLPGTAGNYASAPDEAALDITGDIDIRLDIAAPSYTPASPSSILSKYLPTGNQRSWYVELRANGELAFLWSIDGTAVLSKVATVDPTDVVADDSRVQLRVYMDATTGTVTFEYRTDGVINSVIGWLPLGTPVTGSATSIFAGTASVDFGGLNAGTSTLFGGNYYRVQIYDGIDGTLVFDADFTNKLAYTTSDLDTLEAETGQVVTINRSATGYKSVVVYGDGNRSAFVTAIDDYFELGNHPDLNFGDDEPFTLFSVWRLYDTQASDARLVDKRGVAGAGYLISINTTNIQSRIFVEGTAGSGVDVDATAERIGELTSFSGIRTATTVEALTEGVTDGSSADTSTDLTNTDPLRVGSLSDSVASIAEGEFFGGCLFDRALSTGEHAAVVAYFQQVIAGSLAAGSAFSDGFSDGFS